MSLPRRTIGWGTVPPLAAALALGIGAAYVARLAARPLAFLLIAIAIAEALAPLVARLARFMPRMLAITAVYAVLFAFVALVAWLVVPMLLAQGQELVARAPELIARLQAWIDRWDHLTGGSLGGAISLVPNDLGRIVVGLPARVLRWLVNPLVVLFLSIYWLIGTRQLEHFVLSLFPERDRESVRATLVEMGRAMGGYVRGAAINAVVMGALAWIGLKLIGVNYALVLGVLTMLGEPIPIIGPIIVAIPIVMVALLQSATKALLAVALYTVLQQIEGHLLTPNIMRGETNVPQTLVIFALLTGAAVGGLLGVLASIPLAAAARVFLLRVVVPRIRRWSGALPSDA